MAVSLQSLVADYLSQDDDWRKRLTRDWPTIVGGLHTKMRLEKIVQDTVVVGVYELHWMQELFMISSMILATINQKLGGPHVAKLRFVAAGTKQEAPVKNKRYVRPSGGCSERKPLTPQQKKALENIDDEQLRAALIKLWYRCQS